MGYGLMPFPGHPFVYDIQAHKVVGDVPGNGRISLFLDSDWLDKRIKRQ
jgi:hypothetical protein